VKPAKATHRRTQRDGPRRFCPARNDRDAPHRRRRRVHAPAPRRDAPGRGRCGGDRTHWRGRAPAHRGSHDPAQRYPRQGRHDRRWRSDSEDREGPDRLVLPRQVGEGGQHLSTEHAQAESPPPARERPSEHRTGRTLPAHPSHHFSPTDTHPGSQCQVSRLALDVQRAGIPEPTQSNHPRRTQAPERPWRAPLWGTGPPVVRFRASRRRGGSGPGRSPGPARRRR